MPYLYLLFLSISVLISTSISAVPLLDPTMPADYKGKQSVTADTALTDDSEAPIWVLNTTLIDPYRKVAIINGQQLVVGDEIDGAEVVKISHQFVQLRYQEKLITINLHSSFISKIKSK